MSGGHGTIVLLIKIDKGQIQMKEKINRFSPAALFFIIWFFFAVCSVIFLLLTHGDRLDVLVFVGFILSKSGF